MSAMHDPHNYTGKMRRALVRLEQSDLSADNKLLITKFKDDCLLQLSVGRTLRYVQLMTRISGWLAKDLAEATEDDLKVVVARVNASDNAEYTKQFYKITLRKFFSWLKKEEKPPIIRWIRATVKLNNSKLPEELLTVEEVECLINVTSNPRDKAMISVLYESGCRIGEMLNMRLRDVEFDQYGAKLNVTGKTGPRRVRIVASAIHLSEWINNHPNRDNLEAGLWSRRKGKYDVEYGGVRVLLAQLCERAGIKKRVYPHIFRHSRATHLANHLTEAQMKEYFGWTQSSKMASVYVHLSGRDVDNALLKVYGIANNDHEKHETEFKPKPCMRCEESNPPTNKYCKRCGMPLEKNAFLNLVRSETNRSEFDGLLDRLMEDNDFKELLTRKVEALGAKH